MKKLFFLFKIIISVSFLFLFCTTHHPHKPVQEEADTYTYEMMYKDSFDLIIKEVENPTIIDTLYTEMYIAYNTIGEDFNNYSKESYNIALDRIDKLVEIDTVILHRIFFLDKKLNLYSFSGDFDSFYKTSYQQYNLLPEKSMNRLFSLSQLFLVTNQLDSAKIYLDKTIEISEEVIQTSNNNKKRLFAFETKINSLILQKKDIEAKAFIRKMLNEEKDTEILKYLNGINNHNYYEMLKKKLLTITNKEELFNIRKKIQTTTNKEELLELRKKYSKHYTK